MIGQPPLPPVGDRTTARRRRLPGRWLSGKWLAALPGLLLAAVPAAAQVPENPYAYIRGTDIGRDTVSNSKLAIPKGSPDTWLRVNFRNLGYYLGHPGWGVRIKHLILRTSGGPYHQWDTIPGSHYPQLRVECEGRVINREDGSIAGWTPPYYATCELLIADDGTVSSRHTPLELLVSTLDGDYAITVASYNMWDNKPQ